MSADEQDMVPIQVEATLWPEDEGSLRQVMVGMGRPSWVLTAKEQDDGSVLLAVEGTGPADMLAALLYAVATTLDPTLAEGDDSADT